MYYSTSGTQPQTYSNHKKPSSAILKVQQASDRDGEKLSPVDLTIREATPVQLPPLTWAHYHTTPVCMMVRNTGFTVMIRAKYDQELPYIASGPLTDNYVFSQIHFHWGEHNNTGSGHAVHGVRYPLEMHVVHLKKGYTMSEALKSKDGIAVMVHLFALREERNTQLDQLTAILQFIQKCKCSAELHDTPLSEIVHPFTSNYFLYWGAVSCPMGQYRILWFISRNVLPVSTRQLQEFRKLCNPEGELLLTNSSKPQPLSGRSLFLVSPSERTNITMYGISHQSAQGKAFVASEESIDIRDAEYKSLVALECNEYETCKICPVPKRLHQTANNKGGSPLKVNEGDTSVEESCIELGNSSDNSGVRVQTEMKYKDNAKRQRVITNVNVTTCKHNCKARCSSSEALYSVVSARGNELHLKRKPNLVRYANPSVEQACMLLSDHPTFSAPSLTSPGGNLSVKQEHTNLSHLPMTNQSSELVTAVTKRDSNIAVKNRGNGQLKPQTEQVQAIYQPNKNEFEYETTSEEVSKSTRKGKKVTIQGFESLEDKYSRNFNNEQYESARDNPTTENVGPLITSKKDLSGCLDQPNTTSEGYNVYYGMEEEKETSQEETARHFLIQQVQNKKPFYKVLKDIPKSKLQPLSKVKDTSNSNNNNNQNKPTESLLKEGETDLKSVEQQKVNNIEQSDYELFCQEGYYFGREHENKNKKELYYKENLPFYPIPTSHNTENRVRNLQNENKRLQKKVNDLNPHYRVSLVVKTTVSDHRKLGNKKKESKVPKYTVTKISPVENTKYIPQKTSYSDIKKCHGKKQSVEYMDNLYYAKPIIEDSKKDLNTSHYPEENNILQNFNNEYYNITTERDHREERKEAQVFIKTNQIGKNNPKLNILNENQIGNQPQQCSIGHDPQLKKPLFKETGPKKNVIKSDIKAKDNSPEREENVSTFISQEETEDSNLIKKVDIYHGINEPDEHIRIIDKNITGTIGKTQSTEVIFQSKQIEAASPKKTETDKQINYNFVRSKHPEPQIDIKESPNYKTKPSTVICQNLSLDQQIKGKTKIRHRVVYEDNNNVKMLEAPKERPIQEEQHVESKKLHGVSETYEESTHEHSSAHFESTKQTFQTTLQKYNKSTPINNQISKNLNYSDNEQERQDIVGHNSLEANKNIVGNQITSTLLKSNKHLIDDGNKIVTSTQKSTANVAEQIESEYPQNNKNLTNHGNYPSNYSTYAFEEQSSVNKFSEHAKHQKKITYENYRTDINSKKQSDKQKHFPHSSSAKQITQEENRTSPPTEISIQEVQPIVQPNLQTAKDQNKLNQSTNNELEFEEILEEQNEVHTTKRMREKTTTVHGRGETSYKLPSQDPIINKHSSQYEITIDKIKIPEPRYIIRTPKPPLIEYEAYPTDLQKPYEIKTETLEETSLTVTTNKTFMAFKKINVKSVLNEPSIVESKKCVTSPLIKQDELSKPNTESNDVVSGFNYGKTGSENVAAINNTINTIKESLSEKDKIKLVHRQQIIQSSSKKSIGPKDLEEKQTNSRSLQKEENDKQICNKINEAPDETYKQYEYSETSSRAKQHYSRKEEKLMYQNKLSVEENEYISIPDKEKQPKESTHVENIFPGVKGNNNFHLISTLNETENSKNISERNIKIVVGSYMQQKSSPIMTQSMAPEYPGKEPVSKEKNNANSIHSPQDNKKNEVGQFISEEYYESVKEEQKQKSAQKYFVSFRGVKDSSHPGPSNEYGLLQNNRPNDSVRQESVYREMEEEPLQDVSTSMIGPGRSEGGGTFQNVTVSEESETRKNNSQILQQQQISQRGSSLQEGQSLHHCNVPIDKNDGNIVIILRQPITKQEHLSPNITVDLSDRHQMTTEELNEQNVQVHEIKKGTKNQRVTIKSINPGKSNSSDVYCALIMGDSSEDDANTSPSDSNEKILDTTNYNLTLRSSNKMNIEKDPNTEKNSKAEVNIRPSSKPGTSTDHGSAQDTNECCCAFKISEIYDLTSDSRAVAAGGVNRSPIRIDTRSALVQKYPPLQFYKHWNIAGDALLVNNGKTLQVTLLENTTRPVLVGGPLQGDYVFHELHFHWGIKDCCGTEHIVDGQRYAVEAHFLYFKSEYESMTEAMKYSNGLAVVALILTIGGPVNIHFAELIKDMHLLREANSGTYVPATSVFAWIKPAMDSTKGYFCYKGTLTNSPQSIENATWLVFPEPVLFCCQQSNEFRKLKSTNGDLLKKNYRPPQPLNNRIVHYVPV